MLKFTNPYVSYLKPKPFNSVNEDVGKNMRP